jgi:molybdopterin converting factor small subunit
MKLVVALSDVATGDRFTVCSHGPRLRRGDELVRLTGSNDRGQAGIPWASVSTRERAGVQVELQLFAVARQAAGTGRLRLDLPEPATVAALRSAVCERVPALRPLLPAMWVAVDAVYATDEVVIGPGAELALIPPVSGGAGRRPEPAHTAPRRRLRVANLTIHPLALEMIPESVAREYQILPLDFDGERLTLVFARGSAVLEQITLLRSVLSFANPICWSRADPKLLGQAIDEVYGLLATEVSHCPPEFRAGCPRLWLCLVPTADPKVRICSDCRHLVHLCQTESQARAQESEARRVALYRPVAGDPVDAFEFDDLAEDRP